MDKGHVREQFVGHANSFTQVSLNRLVVAAVHHQPLVGGGIVTNICQFLFPESQSFIFIHWNFVPVTVPVGKKNTEYATTIRPLPVHFRKLRGKLLIFEDLIVKADWFDTTPKGCYVNAWFLKNLRSLPHIPKGIREVTNLRRFAPFSAFSLSNQGIADIGFTGDQVIILQNVEGTNLELALVDITLHLVAIFRANF